MQNTNMGYGCASFAKTKEEIKSQDENGTILVFSPKLVLIGFSPPIKNLPCFMVSCCSFSSLKHVNCYYLNSLNNAHFCSFYNYTQIWDETWGPTKAQRHGDFKG